MKAKLMRFLMGMIACLMLAGAVAPASAQVVVRVGPQRRHYYHHRYYHRHYYHHHYYHHYRR